MDKFIYPYVVRIKKAKDATELADIVESIYQDGFEDGVNAEQAEGETNDTKRSA